MDMMARAVGYIVAGSADTAAGKSPAAIDKASAIKLVAAVGIVWIVVLALLLGMPV